MKKILIVGTYPIVDPRHGGQKRVSAMVENYKKNGIDAKYVAVYHKAFYPDASRGDIAIDSDPSKMTPIEMYTTDVASGKSIYDDVKVKQRMSAIIAEFKPEAIQIEQMFPYFGLEKLVKELNWRGEFIYSSHNVEYELKEEILRGTDCSEAEIKAAVSELKGMELQLVRDAVLTIACTEADKKVFAKSNKPSPNIVVASNGISKSAFNKSEVSALVGKKFLKNSKERVVLFVGSAHPPNLTGFEEMTRFAFAFLPANTRLFVAGGVSDLIYQKYIELPNYMKLVFDEKVCLMGQVEPEELAGILAVSEAIVLPITEGGGSNLKTAEAILADKKIIATHYAFRSFEKYQDLPNIYFGDSELEFRRSLDRALATTKKARTSEETAFAEGVLWSNILGSAVRAVKAL